jgi:nucleotide-binding universal stress UspA family protein
MKVDKILVPLDGSTLAETALSKAVEFAKENPEAVLMLLRAAEASALPGIDAIEAQIEAVREAEEYLAAVETRLYATGVKQVRTSVWYGRPAPAIVEAAHVSKVDLIVMTTHGRSGLGRFFLGSVAESVLRGTTTPILLLHAHGAPVEQPMGTAEAVPPRETAHV